MFKYIAPLRHVYVFAGFLTGFPNGALKTKFNLEGEDAAKVSDAFGCGPLGVAGDCHCPSDGWGVVDMA